MLLAYNDMPPKVFCLTFRGYINFVLIMVALLINPLFLLCSVRQLRQSARRKSRMISENELLLQLYAFPFRHVLYSCLLQVLLIGFYKGNENHLNHQNCIFPSSYLLCPMQIAATDIADSYISVAGYLIDFMQNDLSKISYSFTNEKLQREIQTTAAFIKKLQIQLDEQ